MILCPLSMLLFINQAFGVDHSAFSAKCDGAPPRLLRLALTCCRLDPGQRPSFARLVDILSDDEAMMRLTDEEDEDIELDSLS